MLWVTQNVAGPPHAPKKNHHPLIFSSGGQPGVGSGIWPAAPAATGFTPNPWSRKNGHFPPPPNPQKPRSTPGPVKHSLVPPGFWKAPVPGAGSRLGMPATPAMPVRVQRALSKVGVSQGPPPPLKSGAARVTAFTRSKVCRLIKNRSGDLFIMLVNK